MWTLHKLFCIYNIVFAISVLLVVADYFIFHSLNAAGWWMVFILVLLSVIITKCVYSYLKCNEYLHKKIGKTNYVLFMIGYVVQLLCMLVVLPESINTITNHFTEPGLENGRSLAFGYGSFIFCVCTFITGFTDIILHDRIKSYLLSSEGLLEPSADDPQ